MERICLAAGEPECFALIPCGTLILPLLAASRPAPAAAPAAAPEPAR
jgi:hypothetical protein